MPFLALVPIGIWISLGLTVAMSALQAGLSALPQKKPKAQTFTFDDETQSVYDPLAPWKILNGEGRSGGAIIYKRTNLARSNLWMVVAIGPGPIAAFGDLWMGDEPVFVTGAADGSVQGTYASKLFCWTHLGTDDDTVDTNLQAAFPDDWDGNHRLRGIAYVVLKFVSDATLYAHGIPNPSFSYRGLAHEDTRTGLTIYTDNPVMVIRSWLMNTVYGRRLPASRIDTASCNDEADYCDEYVPTPQRSDYASVWQAQTFTAVAGTDIITYIDGWSGADREHGLRYNDPVRFVAGGGLPGGLSAGVTYYARPLTRTTLKVATSKTATTTVDITTAGTTPNIVVLQGYRMTLGGNFAAATAVDATADTITMQENASNFYPRLLRTGSRFQITLGTGGVVPAGLAVATDYYAIIIDNHTIQAAVSPLNASLASAINITSAGTQPVQVAIKSNASPTCQALAAPDTLVTVADVGFRTGDVLIVGQRGAGTLPANLDVGDVFFWRRASDTTGTLHTNRLDSQLGKEALVLADVGFFTLETDRALQDDIQFMPTGTMISIDTADVDTSTRTITSVGTSADTITENGTTALPAGAPVVFSGSLPSPIVAGTTYYAGVASGSSGAWVWQIFTTLAAAIADTGPINLTTGTTGGTLVGTSSIGGTTTEYYVINRGRGFADGHITGVIDLAATLSDALNDIPITRTTGVGGQVYHQITRTKERRFTLNGSFDTDTTYGEVLQAMLSSIGGSADPSGGKWRILPARYRPPEITLDGDDVYSGAVELSTLLPANKAANTLTGVYTNPINLDVPTNFPTLIDSDAVEEEGGQTIQDSMVLPFTNSEPMALRLALIELNRRRRQKTITFPTDLAGGWLIAVGDSFIVDLPGIGQDGTPQVYECTRWALNTSTAAAGQSAPLPLISITGRQNDPFVCREAAV